MQSLPSISTFATVALNTVKAPVFGTVAGAAGVLTVAAAALYFSREKFASPLTPSQVQANQAFDRVRANVVKTYGYVFGSFSITAATAVLSHTSGLSLRIATLNPWIYAGAFAISLFATTYLTLTTPHQEVAKKHFCWTALNSVMGIALSPLCYIDAALLAKAGGLTIGTSAVFTLMGMLAPDESFLKVKGPLLAALTALSAAAFVTSFFPATAVAVLAENAYLIGGLIIFCAVLAGDTQGLMKRAKDTSFDAINQSIIIYNNMLNIFMKILILMLKHQQNKTQKA